jgi:hypothetical protein
VEEAERDQEPEVRALRSEGKGVLGMERKRRLKDWEVEIGAWAPRERRGEAELTARRVERRAVEVMGKCILMGCCWWWCLWFSKRGSCWSSETIDVDAERGVVGEVGRI